MTSSAESTTQKLAEAHEHHDKAAEHHKNAAHHHEEAAKHLRDGDAAKGAHHAHVAHSHGLYAAEHADNASKSFAKRHGQSNARD